MDMNLFWLRRGRHRFATLRCCTKFCVEVSVDKWLRCPRDVQNAIKSLLEHNCAEDVYHCPAGMTKDLCIAQFLCPKSGDTKLLYFI